MLRNSKGITLLELMIVVFIAGIIASLAIPRFMKTTAISKQSEAKGILKQIYTLERSWFQEYGSYTEDLAALGLELMAQRWHEYSIVSTGTTFTATAHAAAPGVDDDPTPDTWTIDGSGAIIGVSDDVKN